MKRIELKSMTLRNWRGEKERTTRFNEGGPTCIYGANGLGKSRHFDAFCWLLFGKDSQNRTDYELRTYDTRHNPLHHVECSVEATLTIDGAPLTIKKEWCEKWVKPLGQAEEVFKGNEVKCTWNGTPVKKGDFNSRVEKEIIESGLFMMITNPRYFPVTMSWQMQRKALLLMAGEKSDYELASGNAEFKALLDELGGKSLSDFRKEIAAAKKRLKDEADKIPARIDEVQRGMPAAEDWEALKTEIEKTRHDIDDIDRQLQDSDARSAAQRKERDYINKEIFISQAEQASILRKAKEQAQAECDKANEYRHGIEAGLKKAHEELAEANIDLKRNEARVSYLQGEVESTERQLAELREEWYTINKTAYDESQDICPCCGQRMPEDRIAEARAKFADSKKAKLAANNERGKALAQQKASLKSEMDQREADTALLRTKVETAENGIATFSKTLQETPIATAREVVKENIPAWQAEQEKIEGLEKKLESLNSFKATNDLDDLNDLKERKTVLQGVLEGQTLRLARHERIEEANKRMAELEKQGRDLAQRMADLEKREYVAAQFSKKKIEDSEGRINGMFKTVRFKLFDHTQDGNEYETCVPLVSGVPYSVANTASQINAGLEIINTLCKFHNVTAPIFIDNAESVNEFTPTQSQIIFLKVTEDKVLTIK